jgi:hypothetical protein
MTIQTTNIDSISGDAVDLTNGDEIIFTIANGVVIESQYANGIVADTNRKFFIYNNASVFANGTGVGLEEAYPSDSGRSIGS